MKVLLGTRKGLFVYEKRNSKWEISDFHFEAVSVPYVTMIGDTIWAGLNHGHWGAKLHKSTDGGKTFTEVSVPAFPEKLEEKFISTWSLAEDSSGRLYLGAEPATLFYSDNQGESWQHIESFYDMPGRDQWFGGATEAHCLHSLMIDPSDDKHIICGVSCAGVIVSKDRGDSWNYSSKGMKAYFMPDPDCEVGQDPHHVAMSPSNPEVLWQQNHCGIFKSNDMGQSWIDLSKNPGLVSSFGWGVVIDEKNPDVAYTVPAKSDESRVLVDNKLVVQKTTDGGQSWTVHRQGLPQNDCFDICYRHALALKGQTLAFGTTTGNLYISEDAAENWQSVSHNLPPIYGVWMM